ncbi:odorant receptor coreceptor-like [Contarinia nasturtii]|uniref:odorant receptor coreceptor-like n=1 Tax=Contarinia nasturtii TaxID=265458 RepID=UPI0012D41DC0|nr:odorant receptor coreceptor-like [Contarinia nasturtii]
MSITSCLWQISKAILLGEIIEALHMLMMLCIHSQSLLAFCYFGELVTGNIDDVNDMFWQCDWYYLPIKIQQLMPIILMNSEKTIYIGECAGLNASLDVFGKIIKAAVSYLTILRQFD